VVIHDSFDGVENAKAQQHGPGEQLIRPLQMMAMSCPPKREEARQHEQIRHTVKNAVPAGIELQVFDCVGWVPAAQHVMPLKDLMQHNAIEKSSQAEAEKDAGSERKLQPWLSCAEHR